MYLWPFFVIYSLFKIPLALVKGMLIGQILVLVTLNCLAFWVNVVFVCLTEVAFGFFFFSSLGFLSKSYRLA